MSVPNTLDGFDVTAAVARMLGQPMLWWQAVGLFVEHFAGWEEAWQACLGDDEREGQRVHALRSGAVNVGAVGLAEWAAALEAQLTDRLAGRVTTVPDNLRQGLRDAFRQTWHAAAEAWRAGQPDAGGQA